MELYKIYCMLTEKDAGADEAVRVIDESGEDYLFPASYFAPIKLPYKEMGPFFHDAWMSCLLDPPIPHLTNTDGEDI